MRNYLVSAQFSIQATDAAHAENIVQNAVEATPNHIETDDVTAELDPMDDDDQQGPPNAHLVKSQDEYDTMLDDWNDELDTVAADED